MTAGVLLVLLAVQGSAADSLFSYDRAAPLAVQDRLVRSLEDALLARKDVDPARLAYVGHSYGAQFGAVMSALDQRVRAVVLMAGIPDNATFLVESEDHDILVYRARWTQAQIDRYMQVTAPVDAINWVGKISPRPLLMQFGQFERSIPLVSMQRYAASAREPKTILWYPTGHELNDPKAWTDRTTWVVQQLGL